MGPHSQIWVELTHRAMQAHLDYLGHRDDVEGIDAFMRSIQDLGPGLELSRIMPELIEMSLPSSLNHAPLARTLFVLAANYLDTERLLKLLTSSRYVAQLPEPVSRLAAFLDRRKGSHPPAGLLLEAAGVFEEQWEPLVLLRFADVSLQTARTDLLDVDILAKLADISRSRWGRQYSDRIKQIVAYFSTDHVLPTLKEPGPFYLWQFCCCKKPTAN